MQRTGIVVEGKIGTWYIIDETWRHGEKLYLLEHEEYGEDVEGLIVIYDGDEDVFRLIMDEVYNGFGDYDDNDEFTW